MRHDAFLGCDARVKLPRMTQHALWDKIGYHTSCPASFLVLSGLSRGSQLPGGYRTHLWPLWYGCADSADPRAR